MPAEQQDVEWMGTMPFEDRLQSKTYAEDVEFEIRVECDPRDEGQSVKARQFVSERV